MRPRSVIMLLRLINTLNAPLFKLQLLPTAEAFECCVALNVFKTRGAKEAGKNLRI